MSADWIALRRLFTLLLQDQGSRRAFTLGSVEEIVGVALSVASPLLLGRALEHLHDEGSGERFGLVLAFVTSWIAPSLLGAFKPVRTAAIVAVLYDRLVGPILRQQLPPLAIAHDRAPGRVTGALERLPFNLQVVLDGVVWRAVPILLQVLLTLAALAWVLPFRYAGILGAILLAYLVLADRGAARLIERSDALTQSVLSLSGDIADVVANAERVICNGALEQELARLNVATRRRHIANRQMANAIASASGGQTLLLLTGLSLVLGLAAYDVAAHRLSGADFVVLQAFALRLAIPLSGLAVTLRQAAGALSDTRETLALAGPGRAPAVADQPQAVGPADLVLDQVSFAYPGGLLELRQICLSIAPGKMVAIVGANGSGKSTLARLMAGLLAPNQGRVLIGGVDLQNVSLKSRPTFVLYVPQFIGLFHRPLRENALYPPASADETNLIRQLEAWRFYADDGAICLGGPSGERGGALSGGQVQKLELARLCAVETPVLILDESTSALDAASEADVIATLRARALGRLLIFVTHKRELAAKADCVIFVVAGRILATGPHETLMATTEYRDLWT